MRYWLVLFVFAVTACQEKGFVRASKIDNRTQAIGGPSSLADIGDFILENDQIRVAILQGDNSLGPGVFGGSLIDADLRRPEPEFRGGNGLDQWGELFPTANLLTPRPIDEDEDLEVFVVAGGNQNGCPIPPQDVTCAIIRVQGRGDNFMASLSPLALLLGAFSFQTDYVLRPGDRHVEIITSIDRLGTEFGEGEVGSVELPPFFGPVDLLGIMIGAQSGNPEHSALKGGAATGDFVIFGKRTSIFSDGVGFDEDTELTDIILTGGNPVAEPFAFPYLVASGDRVSYGYLSLGGPNDAGGDLLIPIFTSAVTVAFTHQISCLLDAADDSTCDNLRFLSWRRAFVVGEGDVGSVLRETYRLQGETPGEVSGSVFDSNTGKPISGAQVFAFADPLADPERAQDPNCAPLLNAKQNNESVDFSDLITCAKINREQETNLGIASEMKTDVGTDLIKDGNYNGPLLPGDYFLVAWTKSRLPSKALPISVSVGQEVNANLSLNPAGRILFEVRNEVGKLSPAKFTAIGEACNPAADPRCDPLTQSYGPRRLAFGDSLVGDGISDVERTISGQGEMQLEPGRYRILVSRGPEYSIDEFLVDLPDDGRAINLFAQVNKVVDTSGWISGDFHVHGVNSFDSGVEDRTRVASFIVEGVDLLSSSDHDYVTDYGPAVAALGAEELIKTQIGLESTTLELGHYIGFPLVIDERLQANGAFDWTNQTPGEIINELRSLGTLEPDAIRQTECDLQGDLDCNDAVVMVAHPRDGFFGYFDQYGLDSYSLGVDPGFFPVVNPLQAAENFTDRFDAFELLNGKHFDTVRTPSISEVAAFEAGIDDILANTELSASEKRALSDELSRQFVPAVMTRTLQEQQSLGFDEDGLRACVDDGQCNSGQICDPHRTQCIQESVCVPGTSGNCNAGEACDPILQRCVFACTDNQDCRPDEICNPDGTCTQTTCDIETAALFPDQPCPEQDGVIEDWFRLLNFGIKKTGMAASDTHDLTGIEAGTPRTFICSDADSPGAIDPLEIAKSLREGCAFASNGPVINFTIDGERLGSLVSSNREVTLDIQVQTPGWFDITRVELYRNGELIEEFDVPAPNESTLAFSETFTDTPPRDAWYVVAVLGTGTRESSIDASANLPARNLSPVYTSVTTPSIQIGEALSGALGDIVIAGIRLGDVIGTPPPFPQVSPVLPYAITNPIYVDANQNGSFDPPGLGEAFLVRAAKTGLMRFPLSSQPYLQRRTSTLPDDFALELRHLLRQHRWLSKISHHGRYR